MYKYQSANIGAHTILIYLLVSTQQQQEVNVILNSYLNHQECHTMIITHDKHFVAWNRVRKLRERRTQFVTTQEEVQIDYPANKYYSGKCPCPCQCLIVLCIPVTRT
jgi:hypothetical protein